MQTFMSGAMTMGYFIAGLFFLRFWMGTRDRLFVFFALAFWILAVQRAALGLTNESLEDRTALYAMRLLAFILILIAIIDKNRAQSPEK